MIDFSNLLSGKARADSERALLKLQRCFLIGGILGSLSACFFDIPIAAFSIDMVCGNLFLSFIKFFGFTFLCCVFSTSYLGIFLIPASVAAFSFFSAVFFAHGFSFFGLRGFLFFFLSIVLPALIVFPASIFVGCGALEQSALLFEVRFKYSYSRNGRFFVFYCLLSLAGAIALAFYSGLILEKVLCGFV